MTCFTCDIELGFILCSGYKIFLSKGQIKILENKETRIKSRHSCILIEVYDVVALLTHKFY